MSGVDVTVVIPSVGRAELSRAIESVRCQSFNGRVQIIVVLDSPEFEPATRENLESAGVDVVIWTGGRKGAAYARNRGVEAAEGRYTAFLDDDDEWYPNKLAEQVAVADTIAASGLTPVISNCHVQVDSATGRQSPSVPRRPFVNDRGISHYLFAHRRPGGGRASMYTSTLLCATSLRNHVQWDEGLSRHQDWDWLIKAEAAPNSHITQLPLALTKIHTGSTGSISASKDWTSSVQWADSVLSPIDSRVYVDFLAGQTLRYALNARSLEGVSTVIGRMWKSKLFPSFGPMVIGVAGGLAPRATIERAMTWIR